MSGSMGHSRLVILVNERPKSDQKDLKGRKENSRSHSQSFVTVYGLHIRAGFFTLSRCIPAYPQRSSDSRSFSAIRQDESASKNARRTAEI